MLNRSEDERGYFQELYKNKTGIPAFCQISELSINPGKTRGNHYHKDTVEMFLLKKGSVHFVFDFLSEDGKVLGVKAYDLVEPGEWIVTQPYENHTLTSKDGCEMLVFSSRVFDPDDQDTFRLETK